MCYRVGKERSKLSEESVQPEVSTEGQGNTPYGEYLDKLPEDIRGDVEPVFKEWDSNVTKRFQEAADYRKQWEPLEDLNLGAVPRDELESLLQLRELAANDPEQFDAWVRETAQERGLLGNEDPYSNDEFDPFAPEEDKLEPVMSELQQMKERFEAMENEKRVAEAMQMVESQMQEQAEKHPDVPQELAEQFLSMYADVDPDNAVQLAYEAAEKWTVQIQQQMMEQKLGQPEAAEQGSTPDASPEAVKSFKDAQAQVLARLKNN